MSTAKIKSTILEAIRLNGTRKAYIDQNNFKFNDTGRNIDD